MTEKTMDDQLNFYINCQNCGRENHPQQNRCWICGCPLTNTIHEQPIRRHRVAKTVATSAASGITAFFITLGGVLGGILIGIFLAIALVVALFSACINILSGGSAILFI